MRKKIRIFLSEGSICFNHFMLTENQTSDQDDLDLITDIHNSFAFKIRGLWQKKNCIKAILESVTKSWCISVKNQKKGQKRLIKTKIYSPTTCC